MPIGKRLMVVLSVVVAGASVALFFRKDASPFKFWLGGADDPFGKPVERRVGGVEWTEPGAIAGAVRIERSPAAASIAQPGDGDGGAPAFQQSLTPVGALLPPIEGVLGDDDRPAGPEPAAGAFLASQAAAMSHVVVDGDTLSSLAARYLGSAAAYRDIYDYNRGVLSNPDLLPIGAVLRIPPRGAAPAPGLAADELPLVPLRRAPSAGRPDQAAR